MGEWDNRRRAAMVLRLELARIKQQFGMRKISPQNLYNLLISTVCAIALAVVLTRPDYKSIIAVLSTFVTVLCLQIVFLRREVSVLKDQMTEDKRS